MPTLPVPPTPTGHAAQIAVAITRALRQAHGCSDAAQLNKTILTLTHRAGLDAQTITSTNNTLPKTPPDGMPSGDWDVLRDAFAASPRPVMLFLGDRTVPNCGNTYLILPGATPTDTRTHLLITVPKGHPNGPIALELLRYVAAPHMRALATGDARARQHVMLLDQRTVRYVSPHMRTDYPNMVAQTPGARLDEAFAEITEALRTLRRTHARDVRASAIDAHIKLRLTPDRHDPLAPSELPPQTFRIALLGPKEAPLFLLTHNSEAETLQLNRAAQGAIVRSSALDLGSYLVVNAHLRITYATPTLATLLGYDMQSLTGALFFDHLLADDDSGLGAAMQAAMLNPATSPGQSFAEADPVGDVVLLRSNGTRVRVALRLTTLYDPQQTPSPFIGVLIRIDDPDDPTLLREELIARVRAIRHDFLSIEGRLRLNTADLKAALAGQDEHVELLKEIERDIRDWTEYTSLYERLLADTHDVARGSGHHTPPLDLGVIAMKRAARLAAFYAGHFWRSVDAARFACEVVVDDDGPHLVDAATDVETTTEYGMRMLLENAVKYARPAPNEPIRIGVRVRRAPDAPSLSRFEVTNAVDPADLVDTERIWDHGVRYHNALDRRGSGHGLWSLRRMVERAGGTVGFSVDPHAGTATAYFALQRVETLPGVS